MPTLHVRNVPESLYDQIRQRAQMQNRSLSAEVIMLLDHALAAKMKSKEFTVYWRQWWSDQRHIFVDQPFRTGG